MDDSLFRQIKERAHRGGKTFTETIEEAVRRLLAPQRSPLLNRRKARLRLPTVGGKGLQPGVDLDDTASLFDLMDGRR